jgi:hypothetical protein
MEKSEEKEPSLTITGTSQRRRGTEGEEKENHE